MRRNTKHIDLPTHESTKMLKFGLKRSVFNESEKVGYFKYQHIEIPEEFDLRTLKTIYVYNQGQTNSCSSNAISNQLRYLQDVEPSRAFIYINSLITDQQKENNKRPIEDTGCSLKSAYEALYKYKFCEELEHPFDEDHITKFPSTDSYIHAFKNNFISSYRNIYPCIYNIKYVLYQIKKPIVFGMAVYSNFERLTKENNILYRPSTDDLYLGLHAVLAIGFNKDGLIVCNSHGRFFGDEGFFIMAYEYINDENTFEWWVMNS
jgi:C1A family cysteine protease